MSTPTPSPTGDTHPVIVHHQFNQRSPSLSWTAGSNSQHSSRFQKQAHNRCWQWVCCHTDLPQTPDTSTLTAWKYDIYMHAFVRIPKTLTKPSEIWLHCQHMCATIAPLDDGSTTKVTKGWHARSIQSCHLVLDTTSQAQMKRIKMMPLIEKHKRSYNLKTGHG
jgi:hypothetical protein